MEKPLPRVPKPNGRPPFEPTDAQRQIVQVLKSNGVGERVIAANVGCDTKTLRKHFKAELTDGRLQVKAAIGVALVRAALAGNVAAAKYWLSTHGGPEWRISERREIVGRLDTSLADRSTEDLQRELATMRQCPVLDDPDDAGSIH